MAKTVDNYSAFNEVNLSNARSENESYEDYKKRLKQNEQITKLYKTVGRDNFKQMFPNGIVEAIKNASNYPDICHFVKYDDLVAQPEQEFRKIYEFIGEPYYNHKFENLKQVEVNGMGYDDKIVGKNMHKIKTVVRKEYNPYIEKIPERIRQKYGHIRF